MTDNDIEALKQMAVSAVKVEGQKQTPSKEEWDLYLAFKDASPLNTLRLIEHIEWLREELSERRS